MLCEELEGWDGKEEGGLRGWYIFVYKTMTESHCCMEEIKYNNVSSYPLI